MENRTKIKAVARANAFHGLFQAILQPEGVLTMDEIAERLVGEAYTCQQP